MAFEVSVLDWFAKLWEIEKDEYWGYVTTGGTEGNLHGILVGLVFLPTIFFFLHLEIKNKIGYKSAACALLNHKIRDG